MCWLKRAIHSQPGIQPYSLPYNHDGDEGDEGGEGDEGDEGDEGVEVSEDGQSGQRGAGAETETEVMEGPRLSAPGKRCYARSKETNGL